MAAKSSHKIASFHISNDVNALLARRDAISIRFSVQLSVERPNKSEGDGCWVNISGEPAKVVQAQTYIKCLCAPEDTGEVQYPGDLHGFLSDTKLVYDLEKEYQVIISFRDGEREDDPGKAIIKGDSLNVTLALSAIEDLIATKLSDQSSTGSTGNQTYSDQTSNKLDTTLRGISDKGDLTLEREEVAHYSDVMKRLVLSWASESSSTTREVVDLEPSDSESDEEIRTAPHSLPANFVTSTPRAQSKASTSSVKVESAEKFLSMPGTSGLAPIGKPGPMYVDLTERQPVQRVTLDDSDEDTEKSTCTPASSSTSRSSQDSATTNTPSTNSYSSTRTRRYSPTTQTEKDISTITLDDDTTSSDITLKSSSKVPYEVQSMKLVNIGRDRGYDDMEVAQALSLFDPENELNEKSFFSTLNKVRQSQKMASSSTAEKTTIRPIPASRNVAMDSIHKRQMHTLSPSAKAVMPNEKRVKTFSTETVPDVTVIPHEKPSPAARHNQQSTSKPIQEPSQPMLSQQEQLQQIRAQRSQQYMTSNSGSVQPQPFNYAQPSTSSYMQPSSNYSQPSSNYSQPSSNYSQPSSSYGQPSSSHQLPKTDYNLPPVPKEMLHPNPSFNQAAENQLLFPQQTQPDMIASRKAPELPNSAIPRTRMVVLDGSNIAFAHGKKFYGSEKVFSSEGILLAINYLRQTYGATCDNVKAIVPNFRRRDRCTRDANLLDKMEESQYLVFSPCKTMPNGTKIVPYDDRFILDLAVATNGVVISNDKYADLMHEQSGKYRDVISNRVIMFMFVNDLFMIPKDPMGRNGPTLDELLRPASSQYPKVSRTVRQPQPQFPVPQQNYRAQHDNQMTNPSQAAATQLSYRPRQENTTEHRSVAPTAQRSPSETDQLTKSLLEMFPAKIDHIRKLLSRHPHERDAAIFVESLID